MQNPASFFKTDSGEKFELFNSLNSVPQLLIGHNTLIELRNETSVAGTIDHADGFMNIDMTNVVFFDQQLRQHTFDMFHVPARNIRYIHIPRTLKLLPALDQYLNGTSGKKIDSDKPKQRAFKVKRAEERHRATLMELAQTNLDRKK